jgi:hypothetical protein
MGYHKIWNWHGGLPPRTSSSIIPMKATRPPWRVPTQCILARNRNHIHGIENWEMLGNDFWEVCIYIYYYIHNIYNNLFSFLKIPKIFSKVAQSWIRVLLWWSTKLTINLNQNMMGLPNSLPSEALLGIPWAPNAAVYWIPFRSFAKTEGKTLLFGVFGPTGYIYNYIYIIIYIYVKISLNGMYV